MTLHLKNNNEHFMKKNVKKKILFYSVNKLENIYVTNIHLSRRRHPIPCTETIFDKNNFSFYFKFHRKT